MFARYREVFFGLLFGLGASVIDVSMHARMQERAFWEELIWPTPKMLIYRVLFLVLGLAIGWLLWKCCKGERETRRLIFLVETLHREIAGPTTMIYTHAQMLLTGSGAALPTDAEALMRSIYDEAKKLQSLTRDLRV